MSIRKDISTLKRIIGELKGVSINDSNVGLHLIEGRMRIEQAVRAMERINKIKMVSEAQFPPGEV